MTEKRFTETLSTGIVTDNVTGKEYKCEMRIDDELLELLNYIKIWYICINSYAGTPCSFLE